MTFISPRADKYLYTGPASRPGQQMSNITRDHDLYQVFANLYKISLIHGYYAAHIAPLKIINLNKAVNV